MSRWPVDADPASTRALTIDWLIVLAVAGVSTTGVGLEQAWTGTSVELAVFGLATGLPLALRRHRPVLATALVAAVLVAQSLIGGSLHFGSFLAALIAMFSVARHVPTAARSGLGAVVLAGSVLVATREGLREAPTDVVFPVFYFAATWALGRGTRALHARTVSLRRLNEALARDHETSAKLAVAGERIRLARELHDVVAHTVMVMVWQAEAAEELLAEGGDPVRARSAVRNVREAGRRGLADLRSLVDVLREDPEGGQRLPALEDVAELAELISRSGVDVDLTMDVAPHARTMVHPELGSALYRVVQESLTNVIRHSHADRAQVAVTADETAVCVRVLDQGPRRVDPRPGSGHGITGMRERITELGGTLSSTPSADGHLVEAVVPLGRSSS